MAGGKSKQPYTVTTMNLDELNDSMHRIQNELDLLAGLRGPVSIYNSVHYVDANGQILHSWGVKPAIV